MHVSSPVQVVTLQLFVVYFSLKVWMRFLVLLFGVPLDSHYTNALQYQELNKGLLL